MNRPASKLPRYTYDEYRRFEEANPARHEYVDGYILAMAGGTPAHARLQAAVLFALERRLDGGPCQPFPSDLRVKIVATGMATYPDVTVVCGPIETDVADPRAVTNPTLIVEISSDRTEAYDRGEKFEHYRQIPTLETYLLVSHRERRIELRKRAADGTWSVRSSGRGDSLTVAPLGIEVPVDELYERPSLTRTL